MKVGRRLCEDWEDAGRGSCEGCVNVEWKIDGGWAEEERRLLRGQMNVGQRLAGAWAVIGWKLGRGWISVGWRRGGGGDGCGDEGGVGSGDRCGEGSCDEIRGQLVLYLVEVEVDDVVKREECCAYHDNRNGQDDVEVY